MNAPFYSLEEQHRLNKERKARLSSNPWSKVEALEQQNARLVADNTNLQREKLALQKKLNIRAEIMAGQEIEIDILRSIFLAERADVARMILIESAKEAGMSVTDFCFSASQEKEFLRIRDNATWRIRREAKLGLQEMGRLLHRDYTSISAALNREQKRRGAK